MRAFLGLGSNVGDRANYLRQALTAIAGLENSRIENMSSIYETGPWGKRDQAHFLNQVVEVETQLDPDELLRMCKKIEKKCGRGHGKAWGPRTLDIDLLCYGDQTVQEDALQIPHPRLMERRFVLLPLDEIAPNLSIPGWAMTVREALEACPDTGSVTLFLKKEDVFRRMPR
jgi:2-amino-4-hydroxy-6-hydroxymethyldihydropteridine diphosphokinase